MPAKISITLFAQKDFKLPRFTGHIARAITLHIIKNANPSIAQLLHEANVLKPFAVEPLYFKSKMKDENSYLVDSSYPCKLIVKLLDDDFTNELVSCIASNDRIFIREEELKLGEILIEQKCYKELIDQSKEISRFGIRFTTPTYFSRQKSEFFAIFPEPQIVFMNVFRIWKRFVKKKMSKDEFEQYKEWLMKEVGVTRYELMTLPINVERAKAKIGFVGYAFYGINKQEFSKITHTLLQFAEFSNLGGGRTAGMGVVKIHLPDRNGTKK